MFLEEYKEKEFWQISLVLCIRCSGRFNLCCCGTSLRVSNQVNRADVGQPASSPLIDRALRRGNGNLEEESASINYQDSNNPYSVLSEPDSCMRTESLRGKAKVLLRWLSRQGMTQIYPLPSTITCGGLRKAVRETLGDISVLEELSIKTIQKVETDCCAYCEPSFHSALDVWEANRFLPVEVDRSHVERFKAAMRWNVPRGWEGKRRTFVPNGNATLFHRRKEGGNWNNEPFADYCRPELVFSSGKPRVVTLYSAENTRVLGPLHYSLYEHLTRKGWLVSGDITSDRVSTLIGGDYVSIDYSSATDNIKTVYVKAAIEVLKERAFSLSFDEIRCLDVLGELNLGDERVATRGQPMGSVMSFPLLCLINKTVVDLALNSLKEKKFITFSEWRDHHCLINGDDLLTREPRCGGLKSAIVEQGRYVGLVVNLEKTMVSADHAEMNSTLFVDNVKQKKFNYSALWMKPDVENTLVFASESTRNGREFRRVVRANCHILAKQSEKHLTELPFPLQAICRKDKRIRRALTSLPAEKRPQYSGHIRMTEEPPGFRLSRSEKNASMESEIERVRENAVLVTTVRFRTFAVPNASTFSSLLKYRKVRETKMIPSCYLRSFRAVEAQRMGSGFNGLMYVDEFPPCDGSKITQLIDNIRLWKQRKTVPPSCAGEDDFSSNRDFVSLDC